MLFMIIMVVKKVETYLKCLVLI